MKAIQAIKLVLLVVAFALLMASPADARRGKKDEKKEALYPAALREEPVFKTDARIAKQLQDIYNDSQEPGNEEKILERVQKLVESKRADNYIRSFAEIIRADVYENLERYDESIAALQQAIALDGLSNDNHFQIMLRLAQTQLNEDRDADGAATMKRFLEESKSDKPEHIALLGNAYFRIEKYQEAADYLKRAILASPEPNASWQQLLMASYFEMEQPLEAAKVAEEVLAKDPDNKALMLNLATIYYETEQMDKTAALLGDMRSRGLLTEERDYTTAYRLLLNMDGKELTAVEFMQDGLDKGVLKPNLEIYNMMGQAFYFSEQIEKAIAAWTEATKYAKDGEVDLNLARVLYNEQQYPKAKAHANEAIKRGTRRPGDGWMILGNIEMFGLDNNKAAAAAYQKAAKDPENREQALGMLKQAQRN